LSKALAKTYAGTSIGGGPVINAGGGATHRQRRPRLD
jgi:hypothetical protein